jgi:hypothetical protein
MGKASRTKRRTSVRSARRGGGNLGWWVLSGVIFVVGVALIVVFKPDTGETAPIANKDHWHAAIGVNVCGQWLPNAPQSAQDVEGIHTHGDGLIHIHPFLSRAAGKHATVGRYFKLSGWKANENSFTLWDGATHKTGNKCDGKEAAVRWELNGKPQSGNIADYRMQDQDVIALALLPKGEKIGTPPSAAELAAPSDLPGAAPPVTGETTPTTAGGAVPGDTTPTTAPPTSSP